MGDQRRVESGDQKTATGTRQGTLKRIARGEGNELSVYGKQNSRVQGLRRFGNGIQTNYSHVGALYFVRYLKGELVIQMFVS